MSTGFEDERNSIKHGNVLDLSKDHVKINDFIRQ